jgi:hypothetical protein
MSNERFNKVQAEINLKMKKLKVTKDPVLRHDLLVALRPLLSELDKLAAQSINELLEGEHQ